MTKMIVTYCKSLTPDLAYMIAEFAYNSAPLRGQKLDVWDPSGVVDLKWYQSVVVDTKEQGGRKGSVQIHYIDWAHQWDEWIDSDSPRLQPFGSRAMYYRRKPIHENNTCKCEVCHDHFSALMNTVLRSPSLGGMTGFKPTRSSKEWSQE